MNKAYTTWQKKNQETNKNKKNKKKRKEPDPYL